MSDYHSIHMLYIGSSGESGNGLDKRRALESLGVRLASFDTRPYLWQGPRPLRALAHRANWGPSVSALNRDLLRLAEGLSDITHVWVDKGTWLWPGTLAALRDRFGAVLVHYSNDSLFHANRSRHLRAAIPLYAFLFTTKSFELEDYRRLGARRVEAVFDAVREDRFVPCAVSAQQRERYAADISFIGRCEPHYARCLRAAAGCGGDLRIWGPRWPRYARLHGWARPHVRGGGVWFDDYPVALSAAKIGLGLLSKRFPETTTTRSFEIPACGTFLLAERTDEHRSLYEEGKEAEFFASPQELVDKLRYYLAHDEERERIAAAGRERFLASGHTRRDRYRAMLEIVTGAAA